MEIAARKLSAAELEARFFEFLSDARFANLGAWELTDDGEVLVSPVTGNHGYGQVCLASELQSQLGGRAWIEQGIRRLDGAPIVPDVLWSDTEFFEANRQLGLLPKPPRLCVEIVSESNVISRLRDKAKACIALGAEESWILDLPSKVYECYTKDGLTESSLGFDWKAFWRRFATS